MFSGQVFLAGLFLGSRGGSVHHLRAVHRAIMAQALKIEPEYVYLGFSASWKHPGKIHKISLGLQTAKRVPEHQL